MEYILNTSGLIVLPESLLAAKLWLELRIVLLDKSKLNDSLVGL